MAILGLQDSSNYADYRESNWRRAIMLKFPNGMAPLTALLSLTKGKPVDSDDSKFNWYEKAMPTQVITAAGALNNVDVNPDLLMATTGLRPGHIIRNETSPYHEVMKVDNVSADGLTVTLLRGNWGTKYVTIGATDVFAVIGNANSEGSGAPTSISYAPDTYYNYTQIFKTPFDLTGSMMETSVRFDPSGPWPEKMREALMLHIIEQEKAFLKGVRAEYLNATTGYIERTTGGLESFIPAANKISGVTTLTYDLLQGYLKTAFATCLNNQQEKLMLCGNGFADILNRVCKNNAKINLVPKADAFGMKIHQWETVHGTLYLKTHPLMSASAVWSYDAYIIDIPGLVYRYLRNRDTQRKKNVQANDADLRRDMFQTDCGLEVHGGEANMLLQGFTTAGDGDNDD